MKLPKIYVTVEYSKSIYPQQITLKYVDIEYKYTSFTSIWWNDISRQTLKLLEEQSRFYASIEEPTWKLIKYMEENPENVSLMFTDFSEVIEKHRVNVSKDSCIQLYRELKLLSVNCVYIDLKCFNKNELRLLTICACGIEVEKKKLEDLKTRSDISDLVDNWNNSNE